MLTIDRHLVFKEDVMFEKDTHLYIFYFLCFVEEISMDTEEVKVTYYTEQELEGEDYFRVSDDSKDNWK